MGELSDEAAATTARKAALASSVASSGRAVSAPYGVRGAPRRGPLAAPVAGPALQAVIEPLMRARPGSALAAAPGSLLAGSRHSAGFNFVH